MFCPGSAQRDTGCLKGFGTSLWVEYHWIDTESIDIFLKMDALLNRYIEITFFIEFIYDRKGGD